MRREPHAVEVPVCKAAHSLGSLGLPDAIAGLPN
jgi:hypothetical protein